MKNPADLLEVCLELIKYIDNGDPAKDVIEKTPYSENELIYELALDYVKSRAAASDAGFATCAGCYTAAECQSARRCFAGPRASVSR